MKKLVKNAILKSFADMREMGLNPLTLSFPKEMESSYRDDFYTKSVHILRHSLLLAIALYGLFGILDFILIQEMASKLWFIRFVIVIPFLFVPIFK